METAVNNNQTSTNPMHKFDLDLQMLERDIRRMSNLLHSDAVHDLGKAKKIPEVKSKLDDTVEQMQKLVEWVEFIKQSLEKAEKPSSTKQS